MSTGAVFSTNGRWVAYAFRGEGQPRSVVFVEPYPATGAKSQISPNLEDGHHPIWSRNGKELLYTPGPGMPFGALTVNISGPAFTFGAASAFTRTFATVPPSAERPYDIAANAKGEPVVLGLTQNTGPTNDGRIEARVVLNWIEELKARVK